MLMPTTHSDELKLKLVAATGVVVLGPSCVFTEWLSSGKSLLADINGSPILNGATVLFLC